MENIPQIKIVFEDDEVVVVEKPAGLVVNKSDTAKNFTIQQWSENKYFKEEKLNESDFYKRAGIVHRLDKETSGLLILARTEKSFISLQGQFKNGEVQKKYIALVHGRVIPEEGVIDAPVGRLPWNRTRFGVFPMGRQSKTFYKVLKYYINSITKAEEALTLVELSPKTGRTHQIRVHMQYLKFPLFSDELYAGRKQGKIDRKVLPRHFLHASEISFIHPTTGATIALKSDLPNDLQNLLDNLNVLH